MPVLRVRSTSKRIFGRLVASRTTTVRRVLSLSFIATDRPAAQKTHHSAFPLSYAHTFPRSHHISMILGADIRGESLTSHPSRGVATAQHTLQLEGPRKQKAPGAKAIKFRSNKIIDIYRKSFTLLCH